MQHSGCHSRARCFGFGAAAVLAVVAAGSLQARPDSIPTADESVAVETNHNFEQWIISQHRRPPAGPRLRPLAPATPLLWIGSGADGNWSTSANWNLNRAPAAGDDLVFGASARTSAVDDFISLTLQSLSFATNAPAYQLLIKGGGAVAPLLTLTGSGIGNASGVLQNLRVSAGQAAGDRGAVLEFRNGATVAANVRITNGSVTFDYGGSGIDPNGMTQFRENSSAGSGVFFNEGSVTGTLPGGRLQFHGNSNAGSASITNDGGQFFPGTQVAGQGGVTEFRDNASAGNATITNVGVAQNGFPGGGGLIFSNNSTAAQSHIFNQNGGQLAFVDSSTMGSSAIRNFGGDANRTTGAYMTMDNARGGTATVILDGALASGAFGAQIYISAATHLENATVTAHGSDVAGGGGAIIQFDGSGHADNATLIAEGGTNGGGGGTIFFFNSTTGDNARAIVNAGAMLDNSGYQSAAFSIGSIEGAGTFAIGAFSSGGGTFTVGSNDRSTTVSGVIQNAGLYASNPGTLIKTGLGTLTLAGINTYTGSTTLNGGALHVTGSIGNGGVNVNANTSLGGTGTIGGLTSIANSGTIAPGITGVGTLSLGSLSLNANSNLNFDLGQPGIIGGGTNDLLQLSGNLVLDGLLNITDAGGFSFGSYRLINYSGTLTNNVLLLGTLPVGFNGEFAIQTSVSGQVNLIVSSATGILFWDGAQTVANGAVEGGTSNWNNATTNWTTASGLTQRNWSGAMAVFTGTAGTVTLTDNVSTTGMQFSTTGYILNASAGQSITLNGAVSVRSDAGVGARINASIAGGSLTKTGDGTLTLAGDNTYSGGTTVVAGALIVRNAAGLGLGSGLVAVLESATSELRFAGNASAGSVTITNAGSGPSAGNGLTTFTDMATGGTATINNGGNIAAAGTGGALLFEGAARAGSVTINNFGAGFSGPAAPFASQAPGQTSFRGTTADSAAITNFGGLANGVLGGTTFFAADSITGTQASAGNAMITNRGATVAGAFGGSTQFFGSSSAASATLVAEGGTNGGLSGTIRFANTSTGGSARAILHAGDVDSGSLDITSPTNAGMIIGSIEGDGAVFLGSKRLTVGGNRATTFGGVLSDGGFNGGTGGALTKSGTGTLTLTGANTYTGGTIVTDGGLFVSDPNGFGLGSGAVSVFATTTSGLQFFGSGSAGSLQISNLGSNGGVVGLTAFVDGSTAAFASITNQGSTANGGSRGLTEFFGMSTAASATFNNLGSLFAFGLIGGEVHFFDNSNAGSATIFNGGGFAANGEGGQVTFFNTPAAAAPRSIISPRTPATASRERPFSATVRPRERPPSSMAAAASPARPAA